MSKILSTGHAHKLANKKKSCILQLLLINNKSETLGKETPEKL